MQVPACVLLPRTLVGALLNPFGLQAENGSDLWQLQSMNLSDWSSLVVCRQSAWQGLQLLRMPDLLRTQAGLQQGTAVLGPSFPFTQHSTPSLQLGCKEWSLSTYLGPEHILDCHLTFLPTPLTLLARRL